MSTDRATGQRAPRRILPIMLAIAAMVWFVAAFGPQLVGYRAAAPSPATTIAAPDEPIPAEADVFRTHPPDRAVSPTAERRPRTHRRTLAMYRSLRAYPGAPPRIPHGLSYDEMRTTACKTCHERGGYVSRFDAYVPVTPHPEYGNCLQCHVPEDVVVRPALPTGQNSACLQCHVPGGRTPLIAAVDWHPADWPRTNRVAMPGAPPVIPHDLQMRGNCLACHLAPSGVEEIQTSHPERSNCRQCHVPAVTEQDVFTRPLDGAAAKEEGR